MRTTDSRLARIKEIYTELLEQNKILSEQKGKLSIENFELKKRVTELEDTLAKVLNSADKFAESLFECRKAEMVNVVRCKDCKHRGKHKLYQEVLIDNWCEMHGKIAADPNWFCADGERKDNNG